MSTELINGDCLHEIKSVPHNSIDLIVTSPPYDNLRTYNGNNDTWSEQVWRELIAQLYRVTADGGVVVWIVGDATLNGTRPRPPCAHVEELAEQEGVARALGDGRGGICADVLDPGEITVGAEVVDLGSTDRTDEIIGRLRSED